ncbi:MAG: serine/threonine protein kinase, partial [Planctomycetota bacterium]
MTTHHEVGALEIFNDALERDAAERDAFIDEACGGDVALGEDVRSLLAVHVQAESVSFLRPDGHESDTGAPRTAPWSLVGAMVGGYEVLDILGEGGMGMVYRARQAHPERCVALKVVRPGLVGERTLRRFELEADVLGRLQHPGIACIYDAGAADTRLGRQPYFAMELVEGETITDYVRAHDLPTRARLELMARVCDAVHHAHQNGVIHRDLKPANILVDAGGQPKILDFGVARITDSDSAITTIRTDMPQLVGTLQYMSPEQCAGDGTALDTRSDVYSLGVICWQILTDELPYPVRDVAMPEAIRAIREDEPRRLSTISRVFRGDIETIIGKALHKDRDRRYQAASALAADIRRYLRDEPIVARPPSNVYQLSKFARRHKALVGGITATFVVLVIGIVATAIQARRAQAEADKRASTISLLISMPLAQDVRFVANPKLAALLEDIAVTVVPDLEPMVARDVLDRIGVLYYYGGRYDRCEPHFRRQLELNREHLGAGHTLTLRSVGLLASALLQQGKFDEADAELREALAPWGWEAGPRDDRPDDATMRIRLLALT